MKRYIKSNNGKELLDEIDALAKAFESKKAPEDITILGKKVEKLLNNSGVTTNLAAIYLNDEGNWVIPFWVEGDDTLRRASKLINGMNEFYRIKIIDLGDECYYISCIITD